MNPFVGHRRNAAHLGSISPMTNPQRNNDVWTWLQAFSAQKRQEKKNEFWKRMDTRFLGAALGLSVGITIVAALVAHGKVVFW